MVKSAQLSNKEAQEFWVTLRKRVNGYFKENNLKKTATSWYYVKGSFMALLLWAPLVTMLVADVPNWLYMILWLIMGIGMAGVGMNVMHDANHESVSKKMFINKLMGSSMFLLSGNVFNWKVQHNVLHHTYTNLYGKDDDINANGLLRLHPNEPYKKMHKYQLLYFPFLYGIMTLYWAVGKDFLNLASYEKRGLTKQMRTTYAKEMIVLVLTKIVYWFVFMALPLWIGGYGVGITILGFVLMHFAAGFILSFVFQLAHTVEEVEHPEDSNINPATQFAVHQLATTNNFATKNWLVTFFTGGLNFQVEHHLFPGISHVHYPNISKIVRETAAEFKVNYFEHKTFGKAVKSHLGFLKDMGKPNVAMS